MDDYISKPIRAADLTAALERVPAGVLAERNPLRKAKAKRKAGTDG
jgi:hypothetical protein